MAAYEDLIDLERLDDYDGALMAKIQGEFAAIADLPEKVGDLPDGEESANDSAND